MDFENSDVFKESDQDQKTSPGGKIIQSPELENSSNLEHESIQELNFTLTESDQEASNEKMNSPEGETIQSPDHEAISNLEHESINSPEDKTI